jgi:MOSC domain-containing protein YiiM
VGTRLEVGPEVQLEVTQIGKTCHQRCAIFHQVGDCVMPREGIFARVLEGGTVAPGDRVAVISADAIACAGAGAGLRRSENGIRHPPASTR